MVQRLNGAWRPASVPQPAVFPHPLFKTKPGKRKAGSANSGD
jgi:hypothetical protein